MHTMLQFRYIASIGPVLSKIAIGIRLSHEVSMDKKSLVGLAALTLLDLAAPAASAQQWNGAYLGVHGGYRWSDGNLSTPAYVLNNPIDVDPSIAARRETYELDSLIGGLHVGYNFTLGGPWLLGLESDFTVGSGDDQKLRTVTIDGIAYQLNSRTELNWQSTVRARLGFTSGPWLLYGTAGVAFADFEWSESFSRAGAFSIGVSKSEVLTGWVIGAGVEHALTRHWIIRAEYLYEDFGTINVPLAAALLAGTAGRMDVEAQKARIGISFKF